jgi:RsiW-degrading membrane proteinase PrsW (M82 family)
MWLYYIGLAVAPGLAISCYIYWRDRYNREPLRLLIQSFFRGCFAVVPAILFQMAFAKLGWVDKSTNTGVAIYAFIIVAVSEEVSKFYQFKRYFYNKAFDEPYDGITYSVMVSMGFATVENILYVLFSQDPSSTALMRMFTAVPAHATFAIMMGYFVGLARFRFPDSISISYQIIGVCSAILFHGAYDYFLMADAELGIWWGAILSLIAGIVLSFKAIKIHQQRSKSMADEGQFQQQ